MKESFPYRAKVLITQRRYQEAIQVCREGLEAAPDHVEGKVLLGMALLADQQFDQVCREIEPLVIAEPEHALANRLMGEAHLRLGHTAQARQHLEAAKRVQPDSPATLELLEELERATKTGEHRRWADPNDTITVSGRRTALVTDDEESTATAAELSPMVLPGRTGKGPLPDPFAARTDASRGQRDAMSFDAFDEDDETMVADMPSMEEIKRAFPPAVGDANVVGSRTPPLLSPRPTSTATAPRATRRAPSADDLDEQTIAVEVDNDATTSGSADEAFGDDREWGDDDETIATVLPEYRGAAMPEEAAPPESPDKPAGDLSRRSPRSEPSRQTPSPTPPAPLALGDETLPDSVATAPTAPVVTPAVRTSEPTPTGAQNLTWSVDLAIKTPTTSTKEPATSPSSQSAPPLPDGSGDSGGNGAAAGEADESEALEPTSVDVPVGERLARRIAEHGAAAGEDDEAEDLERTSVDVPVGERLARRIAEREAASRGERPDDSKEVGIEGALDDEASLEPELVDDPVSEPPEGPVRSVDFALDPGDIEGTAFEGHFEVSASLDRSLEDIRSRDIPLGSAADTGSAEGDMSAASPPPTGPPDADSTRVLDAASAAIIRAQSGAPLKRAEPELKDASSLSVDQLMSFTDEPLRDLEGTDSFSTLAEGTMVDEESVVEVREKLLEAKRLGKLPPLSALDRARPVTSDEIEKPSSLDLADFVDDDILSDELSAEVAAKASEAAPPTTSDAPAAAPPPVPPAPPRSISDRFPRVPGIRKKKRTLSLDLGRGRDPGISTRAMSGGGAEPSEAEPRSERRTVPEVPGGSALPDRLTAPSTSETRALRPEGHGGASPKPPAPEARDGGRASPKPPGFGSDASPPASDKFLVASTSPTALAVPAHKGGSEATTARSDAKNTSPSSPAAKPKPKRTLHGFGPARPPGEDPLSQPFDPGDFPAAKISLPEPSTSIPLGTDDLIVPGSSSASSDDEVSTKAGAFSVDVPRPLGSELIDLSDQLDQPFDPGDFSSHRIPLPEARPRPSAFDQDNPLSPDEFRTGKGRAVRPLPPVSPLDQPISPDDFTPGPLRKGDIPDPLAEPFWPEDFEEGGQADLRAKAFTIGRPEPPPPPPPPVAPSAVPPPPAGPLVDEELKTQAFVDGRSDPPLPPVGSSMPPQRRGNQPSYIPPPPPPPPRGPASTGEGLSPGMSEHDDLGDDDLLRPPPGMFDEPEPPPRKVTEPIQRSLRDPLLEPPLEPPRAGGGGMYSGPPPPDFSAERPALPSRPSRPPPAKEPAPQRRDAPEQAKPREAAEQAPGKGRLIKIGVLVVAALAVVVGGALGVMAYLSAVEVEEHRAEAQALLERGNHQDYVRAARIYETLLQQDDDDPVLLTEAARVHAMTALEFGTDDDEQAETLIHRAKAAGAEEQQLAAARAAIDIYRGDLGGADKVLNATQPPSNEDAPELIYLRGLWYLRQDKLREALRRFNAASKEAPTDVRMALAQAEALYGQRSISDALKRLDEVQEMSPQNVECRLVRAKILIEAERHFEGGDQAAREVLESLSSQASPGQLGWAKLLRARYFVKREKNLQARDLAVAARDSRPTRDPEFAALLARTLLDINDPEGAREEAKRAVEMAPRLGRYRLLLVEALLEVGDLAAAEENLRTVTNSAKAALLQGRIHLEKNDLAGAERRFGEAAQGEREAPQAKLYLSQIYLKQRRTDQAITLLEQLAKGPPALPEARILLSEAYLTTNQLEKAERALAQAGRDLPNDPRVSINLGKLYAQRGELDKAIHAVQKALSIDPSQPDALVTLGSLHLQVGNTADAEESYDAALKIRPTSPVALLGRARVATAKREFDRAEQLLAKVTGKAPPGQLELARGELELKRYTPARAIPLLEKAAEALPNDPEALALLGDAYVLRGDRSSRREANNAYRKVLSLRQGDPHALIGLAESALYETNTSRARASVKAAAAAVADVTVSKNLEARSYAIKGRLAFEVDYDPSAARSFLERAVEIDPNLAEAHLSLGMVDEDQSRRRDACAHYRRYLELAENGPRADVDEARRGVRESCP